MSKLILGVDAGNHRAKVAGPFGVDSYRTAICDWFERDIVEDFGAGDDMEFEVNGRKGFAGTLASYEDVINGGAMYGDSKAHDDTLIRVLLAIYRYRSKYCPGLNRISIVTGQPIISHKVDDKELIANMLRGNHEYTVNGVIQRITIEEVGVAAEGSGASWANQLTGEIRIIDVGSGTINCATINDMRHINNASATFNFGMETAGDKWGLDSIARAIVRATTSLKWKRDDRVFLCGGIANELLPYLTFHYARIQTLTPQLRKHDGIELLTPLYANAVGFYEIARLSYGA